MSQLTLRAIAHSTAACSGGSLGNVSADQSGVFKKTTWIFKNPSKIQNTTTIQVSPTTSSTPGTCCSARARRTRTGRLMNGTAGRATSGHLSALFHQTSAMPEHSSSIAQAGRLRVFSHCSPPPQCHSSQRRGCSIWASGGLFLAKAALKYHQ